MHPFIHAYQVKYNPRGELNRNKFTENYENSEYTVIITLSDHITVKAILRLSAPLKLFLSFSLFLEMK
jgi:hypothetical protein